MFEIVEKFEKKIADFYGAPYAIATDCCTHAIELCLRQQHIKAVTCPLQTYISVPFTFEKLKLKWDWEDKKWSDFYYIGNTNIIDAAVYWQEDGYIPKTLMCLSFQYKKHLKLGRGGAILLDDHNDYTVLSKMRYDGRDLSVPWAEQNIDTIGYHYYMTPETAQLGLDLFWPATMTKPRKQWSYNDYPDLSKMKVFNEI